MKSPRRVRKARRRARKRRRPPRVIGNDTATAVAYPRAFMESFHDNPFVAVQYPHIEDCQFTATPVLTVTMPHGHGRIGDGDRPQTPSTFMRVLLWLDRIIGELKRLLWPFRPRPKWNILTWYPSKHPRCE